MKRPYQSINLFEDSFKYNQTVVIKKLRLNIIIIMSQKRKQWIMTQQQYEMFCGWRQSFYKSICSANQLQYFPDQKLMKYYVWNMVCFLRSRKQQADQPFKFEKLIFTAQSLFKRYYLVNSYVDQEPMQTCISAIYVAFKLNQYPDDYIRRIASAWRNRQPLQPKRGHDHFGEEEYADKEFKLLSGIGFQTAQTKMIHTIESLYGKIQQQQVKNTEGLLNEIKSILVKVYLSPNLIFLHQGPKISLGVVLLALDRLNCIVDFKKTFGQKFQTMLELNKNEIDQMKGKIQKLEDYNQHSIKEQKTEFYRKLTKIHYKKPEYKKSPKFYPRHDSMHYDQ